jgi:hypothetical protein
VRRLACISQSADADQSHEQEMSYDGCNEAEARATSVVRAVRRVTITPTGNVAGLVNV